MRRNFVLAAAMLIASLGPALAHHSFAMFDPKTLAVLNGTLYAVEWKNPHGWFWIKTTGPDGKDQIWGFEGGSPGAFAAKGMKKSDFVVGEKVKMEYHPLKDGRTGGQFLRVTFPDGREVGDLNTSIDVFRKQGYIK